MEDEYNENVLPNSNKRIRTANYSVEEKNVLIQLVQKYKHILENKKTDAFTNADKEKAWKQVEIEFNAVAPNGTNRCALSLKKAYLNMKKTVRKEVAEEKIFYIKTGGGSAKKKASNPLRELTLETMNEKTVFGFNNQFDSDNTENFATPTQKNHETGLGDEQDQGAECATEDSDTVEIIYINPENKEQMSEVDNRNWSKYAALNLKTPLSSDLKEKIEHVVQGTSKKKPDIQTSNMNTNACAENVKSRRRPGITALPSSEISKLYKQLCEEKLENARLEKTILLNQKKKSELEIKILEVELEIKHQQLKKEEYNVPI